MKRLRTLITIGLCAFVAAGCAACGGGGEKSGKTLINISVYAAGYGQGWIDEACRIYEKDHPEYTFKIRANSRMFDTVKNELNSNVCTSDVILVAGYDYLNLATQGKFAELSSVYDSKVPGTEKTVREAVAKEQYEYRLVGENKDKIYGIPWQDSGANGFVYNKKLFSDNGWTVPETMDGFFELCDKIAEKNVVPLVYGGGQQSGYVSMIPETWLTQYYGYDYMANTFEKYESPDQYRTTETGRRKAYDTLAKLLKGKTSNGSNIALNGSRAFTAQAAQREFVKGNAAMVICGPWFPTEMHSVLKDYPDFEYGFIPLPHINGDKKDADGNDSGEVNYSLAANLLCVPATAPHADVGKDFLLSMFSKESYTSYVKENNGVTRPIDVEIDESVLNDFSKAVYGYYAPAKKKNLCVYETSSSPMAINGYLGLLNFSGSDAYSDMINSADYNAAMSIAAGATQNDYNTALSFWDSKTNNWDSKYLVIS